MYVKFVPREYRVCRETRSKEDYAFSRRNEGMTYKQISKAMGLSIERCRQLVLQSTTRRKQWPYLYPKTEKNDVFKGFVEHYEQVMAENV